MRVLVAGGAGFVGSSLALALKRKYPDWPVMALDNLRRRGSELALQRLKAGGVTFVHGDIRVPNDIGAAGGFDVLLECSAEPSAYAGYDGAARYVIDTNLLGTVNLLEAARVEHALVVFISSSRVYPIAGLRSLPLVDGRTRFSIAPGRSGIGWSAAGIARDFPLDGARTLYGTTKLASEFIIQEFIEMYGLRAVINRCGVIAGPWQMGKVDQGFVALWAARHAYGGAISYAGWGGNGHQVRDILHVDDLFDLVDLQIVESERFKGRIFNVGGGAERSVSLAEMSERCRSMVGRETSYGSDPTTRPGDVPYYVTDNAEITAATGWAPRRSVDDVLSDVFAWLHKYRDMVAPILTA